LVIGNFVKQAFLLQQWRLMPFDLAGMDMFSLLRTKDEKPGVTGKVSFVLQH
jgi:hypothetical protein